MIRSGWSLGRGFASLGTFAALCWSPDDPPAPTPAPTPKPAEPYAVFPTSESFNERVEREARAQLKKKYGLSEKELDERLERAKKLAAALQVHPAVVAFPDWHPKALGKTGQRNNPTNNPNNPTRDSNMRHHERGSQP